MVNKPKNPAVRSPFGFLGLLVSYLPTDREYSDDAGQWANLVQDLREKYEERHPELFRDFTIIEVPRANSYSPQVSEFLTFLQFADATTAYNPGFGRMTINKEAGELLRDRYEAIFADALDDIRDMAEVAATALTPSTT